VVLGAVITDGVIVQRLTDYIWVGLDSVLCESHIIYVARIFRALKESLEKLKLYYANLHPTGDLPADSRYFPSITRYPRGKGFVEFDYVGFLEDTPDCTTLRARTQDGRDIVVKYVDRYGERAHRILAQEGLAPNLLYYGTPHLRDDEPSYQSVSMVVMEYVDGETLAEAKQHLSAEEIKRVQSEVLRALKLLHNHGLVFGDLRLPNVLITRVGKLVKLIDFNWAAEEGQAKYPALISPEIAWPKGVTNLALIRKEHDLEMWKKCFVAVGC
jgi:serine/threonine protein kinase